MQQRGRKQNEISITGGPESGSASCAKFPTPVCQTSHRKLSIFESHPRASEWDIIVHPTAGNPSCHPLVRWLHAKRENACKSFAMQNRTVHSARPKCPLAGNNEKVGINVGLRLFLLGIPAAIPEELTPNDVGKLLRSVYLNEPQAITAISETLSKVLSSSEGNKAAQESIPGAKNRRK